MNGRNGTDRAHGWKRKEMEVDVPVHVSTPLKNYRKRNLFHGSDLRKKQARYRCKHLHGVGLNITANNLCRLRIELAELQEDVSKGITRGTYKANDVGIISINTRIGSLLNDIENRNPEIRNNVALFLNDQNVKTFVDPSRYAEIYAFYKITGMNFTTRRQRRGSLDAKSKKSFLRRWLKSYRRRKRITGEYYQYESYEDEKLMMERLLNYLFDFRLKNIEIVDYRDFAALQIVRFTAIFQNNSIVPSLRAAVFAAICLPIFWVASVDEKLNACKLSSYIIASLFSYVYVTNGDLYEKSLGVFLSKDPKEIDMYTTKDEILLFRELIIKKTEMDEKFLSKIVVLFPWIEFHIFDSRTKKQVIYDRNLKNYSPRDKKKIQSTIDYLAKNKSLLYDTPVKIIIAKETIDGKIKYSPVLDPNGTTMAEIM